MPPSLCAVTGTLYDAAGVPLAGVYLTIVRVVKGGVVVSNEPRRVLAGDGGALAFNILRGSRAWIHAPAVGWDVFGGLPVDIPDAPTADLEDLAPATEPLPSNAATQEALNSEIARAASVEADLQEQIDNINVGATAWGVVTGTLSDQTDLQAALDAKADADSLADEATTRAAADTTLQANITAEAAARAAALSVFTQTVTSNAALDVGDALRALILIDTTAGDVTVTLPPVAGMADRELRFKKVADDNLAVIDGSGSETIDAQLVFNLEMLNQSVTLMAVAGAWVIV